MVYRPGQCLTTQSGDRTCPSYAVQTRANAKCIMTSTNTITSRRSQAGAIDLDALASQTCCQVGHWVGLKCCDNSGISSHGCTRQLGRGSPSRVLFPEYLRAMQGEEGKRSTPLWSKASRNNGRLWSEQIARRRHDRPVVCGRCALRLLDNEHYLFLLPQTDPRTLQSLPLYFSEEMDRLLTCARDEWPIQASQRPPRVQDKVTYTP